MKLMSKIRALFTMKGSQHELELTSAEVRQNGVILHPAEDPTRKYFVKADEVDIIIKPGAEISEEDFIIWDRAVNADPGEASQASNTTEDPVPEPEPAFEPGADKGAPEGEKEAPGHFINPESFNEFVTGTGWQKAKKKSFTLMLYPDEHERLMKLIKDNGYKKVEYILACIEAAKKTSMEANYKRFTEDHARRRKEEAQEAKKAREAEDQAKQAYAEEVNE